MRIDKEKSVVTISRHWHCPDISVTVNSEQIAMHMQLDDYLQALVAEAGNPSAWLTKAKLLERLRAANVAVEEKIKHASAAALE